MSVDHLYKGNKNHRIITLNWTNFDAFTHFEDGHIDSAGTLQHLKQHREGPFAELMKEYMERHVEKQRTHGDGTAKGADQGSFSATF